MNNSQITSFQETDENRYKSILIGIRIPKKYHQEPIVSHLASKFNLEVNIVAAILGKNAQGDGWFNLELRGHYREIDSALIYLNELDIEIWQDSKTETDGW
jgi:ABC-type methionine transport system ATPase subunit